MGGFGPLGGAPLGATLLLDGSSVRVVEGVGLAGAGDPVLVAVIRDFIAANAAAANGADFQTSVTEAVSFGDLAAVVAHALVNEGFSLSASEATQYTAVTIVTDALRLSGVAATQLDAVNVVVSGIAFGILADAYAKEQVTDGINVNVSLTTALEAGMRVVEGLMLGGIPTNSALFGVVVAESLALADGATTALDAVTAVREGLSLALRINAEGDERLAYVFNTESKGLTQFSNWPFNSFAQLGGESGPYYGMTPVGIRALGGTTDDGAAINAQFRLAMTNLGSGRLKRMQAAYLGYTASGDLRLKAIVVGTDGQKEAHCYRLVAQPAATPREARIKIGEGLKSVYWGFALEAIDGAAFEIDVLELLPLLLEGRIQGEGGGLR